VFADADFADLYPTLGQFREGLSDRQAADAVRGRIDWKYLLALELDDPGFDHSVLCEFRGRLLRHGATERLLARVLEAAREAGLLCRRGRQRTDSTHVLAAIRALNRLELVAETLRAALNAIAAAAPGWLRAVAPADWHERYDHRVEGARLPEAAAKRDAYALQVGADGHAMRSWTRSTGPARPRPCLRCPLSPCCGGCGPGTTNGARRTRAVPEVVARSFVSEHSASATTT
jgi:IS5 family transposase